MAKICSALILGFSGFLFSVGVALGEFDVVRRQSTGNLAESLSISMNTSLLKLLFELRREAPRFTDSLSDQDALDEHLEDMVKGASLPLHYLALADVEGNIRSSFPLFSLPEEWGIGRFPSLSKQTEVFKRGYMHYVPALLDRPATLAFIFDVNHGDDAAAPLVFLALLDAHRAFEVLLRGKMMLPWETVKIWGPDGGLLYTKGSSSFDVLSPNHPQSFFLAQPVDLPGERILKEATGIYQGHTFSVQPFESVERRIYWHQSMFIDGDRWIISNLVEKPVNRDRFPSEEMTGQWISEDDEDTRLVAVQTGSSWRMLLSQRGQVTRAEGRILAGHVVSHVVEGVNVKTRIQNLRGQLELTTGRLTLRWLLSSGKSVEARSRAFHRFIPQDTLPEVDPNRIRFRVFH